MGPLPGLSSAHSTGRPAQPPTFPGEAAGSDGRDEVSCIPRFLSGSFGRRNYLQPEGDRVLASSRTCRPGRPAPRGCEILGRSVGKSHPRHHPPARIPFSAFLSRNKLLFASASVDPLTRQLCLVAGGEEAARRGRGWSGGAGGIPFPRPSAVQFSERRNLRLPHSPTPESA